MHGINPCWSPIWQICGLVKEIVSPCIREACAPHEYKELKKNLDELKEKLNKANIMLDETKLQEGGTKILNNEAKEWKEEAEVIIRTAETNIQHWKKGIEATCMCGCLPKCDRRKAANELIQEETEKVDKLMKRHRLVVKGEKRPVSEYVQTSRSADIRKIWECISQREDIKVVCINGTPGVGKTAVAEAVCNTALFDETERFGYVIWVDADYGMTLRSLQEKIMKFLRIELVETDSDKDRASRIRDELVRRKKCLIIVDFLWENFTLEDIGIPEIEAEVGGVVCKVVITSRSRLPCSTIPRVYYCEIEPLSESWVCFERNICSSIDDEARNLLKKVVEGCEGVPEAITSLAHHVEGEMSGETSSNIALSLKEFLSSNPTCFVPLTDTQFQRLECSYKRLEKATHQKCFWYCALYPKSFAIEEEQLIDNWIWEGLLDNYFGSLEEKRKEGRYVLKVLKSARLLEKADSSGTDGSRVKMLSLLHDMAVKIIAKEGLHPHILIKSGNELKDFPPIDDQDGNIHYASFIHNRLVVLNDKPNCPKLSTLLLQNNPIYRFSDNFFSTIPNLKLLDLSYTCILTLPSSICSLSLLKVLRLRHCLELNTLPRLSNLKELIVLDLYGTPVSELPLGIERLKKLERLDLSHTKLTKFQAGLVDKLESLQELLLLINDIEGYSWRSIQSRSNPTEACVEELSRLDRLRILQLNFFNQGAFDEYMRNIPSRPPRTPHFKFCVGGFNTGGILAENSVAFIDEYPVKPLLPDTTLELYLSKCSKRLSPHNTLEKLGLDFQKFKVLNLYDCSGLTHLFSVEMLQCLKNIERVCVRKCWSIVGVIKPAENSSVDSRMVSSSCYLPKLQELVLIDLPNLESICPEQHILECPAFHRFSVWDCGKLKRLPLVVSKAGEEPKKIKLRAKSFMFEDSHHQYKHEEADVPNDIVSFVSTRDEESNSHPLPCNDIKKIFRKLARKEPPPPQSIGDVLSSLYDALNLEILKKSLTRGFNNPSRRRVRTTIKRM